MRFRIAARYWGIIALLHRNYAAIRPHPEAGDSRGKLLVELPKEDGPFILGIENK